MSIKPNGQGNKINKSSASSSSGQVSSSTSQKTSTSLQARLPQDVIPRTQGNRTWKQQSLPAWIGRTTWWDIKNHLSEAKGEREEDDQFNSTLKCPLLQGLIQFKLHDISSLKSVS